MIKYISYRILGLLVILLSTSIVYKSYFFEKDLIKHSDSIKLVREIDSKTDILYIGESSNKTTHSTDFDKRKISQFVSDFYPKLIVDDITKPATHAGIYKVFLKQIPKSNNIKTVIVTLNLRSFGWGWIESDLETALNKNMVLMEEGSPLYNRFRLGFKAYNNDGIKKRSEKVLRKWGTPIKSLENRIDYNSINQWERKVYAKGLENEFGEIDHEKTALAADFVKNFAFEIDTLTNPRIKDFDEIIEISKKRNWNIVFNLLAENTEKGKELLGENWTILMENNRKLLVNYFTRKKVLVVDNLNSVTDSLFTDRGWPTEHYKEEGRQIIASNIAKALKEFHSDEFKEHVFISKEEAIANTNHYQHDMETKQYWTNEFLTDEKAFSGKYSSKVNKETPFGPTLELPFNKLNSNFKNTITYSFQVLVSDTNYKSNLIIEIHNDNDYSTSLIKSLSSFKPGLQWKKITHTFEIPKEYQNAKLVKVFLHNPTSTNVFMDDIHIAFGETP